MLDTELRTMIDGVKDGRMDRRAFIQRMIGLGLTAPMATQLLAIGGVAMAQSPSPYKPTKRGGGGPLKLLWWQGPTLLNPHFATGTKDQDGSRLFYEPLASWDADGNLNPILAAEIPSIQNGGLAADAKSVTWKLKPGVKWHDGKPFTADDVVFNWEYASDPATAAVSIGAYRDITVEKVDDLTVRILFNKPTPFWANAFVGAYGCIIPKHLFADYKGAKSREAPNNLTPVGTGPYKFVEFKPGDLVRGEINPDYHMPNRPYFDTIEMKGGGDAVSAARAVIQTGEYDFAWNMQVEDEVLLRLEKGGKGKTIYAVGRRYRIHRAQLHRPQHRGRRRAVLDEDQASAPLRSGRAQGAVAAGRPRRRSRKSSTAAPAAPPPTTSTGPRSSSPRTPRGNSASRRRPSCSTTPAGSRARTASARRTARS